MEISKMTLLIYTASSPKTATLTTINVFNMNNLHHPCYSSHHLYNLYSNSHLLTNTSTNNNNSQK